MCKLCKDVGTITVALKDKRGMVLKIPCPSCDLGAAAEKRRARQEGYDLGLEAASRIAEGCEEPIVAAAIRYWKFKNVLLQK